MKRSRAERAWPPYSTGHVMPSQPRSPMRRLKAGECPASQESHVGRERAGGVLLGQEGAHLGTQLLHHLGQHRRLEVEAGPAHLPARSVGRRSGPVIVQVTIAGTIPPRSDDRLRPGMAAPVATAFPREQRHGTRAEATEGRSEPSAQPSLAASSAAAFMMRSSARPASATSTSVEVGSAPWARTVSTSRCTSLSR